MEAVGMCDAYQALRPGAVWQLWRFGSDFTTDSQHHFINVHCLGAYHCFHWPHVFSLNMQDLAVTSSVATIGV